MIKLLDYNELKNGITIELLVNNSCNFSCGHCMYNSSSKNKCVYMDISVLLKVKEQVRFLHAMGIGCTINIIGGEPTLNFNKFHDILEEVFSWGVNITVSTNGWWLGNEITEKKFLNSIKDFVNPNGSVIRDDGLMTLVRISDDPFHQKQRKIFDIDSGLEKMFEYNVPRWIFRQKWDVGFYFISPNGRGRNETNIQTLYERYGHKFCYRDFKMELEYIHYDHNGNVTDSCGFGSMYDFGTVDDNIFFIILLIRSYKFDRVQGGADYNCINCVEMVSEWKKNNLSNLRKKFSAFNNFDADLWMDILEPLE